MKSKTKAVIFDLGNVLIPFSYQKACDELAKYSNLTARQIHFRIFYTNELSKYTKGFISTHQFYEWVFRQISATRTFTFTKFSDLWNSIFGENLDAEHILARIKPGIKKFCLSDTNALHWLRTAELPLIKTHFPYSDQQILSFRVSLRKPDKRIFRLAIKRSGVKPQEIVYVDDTPEYVTAFEKLGIRGIVYNCQTDPIEVLESRLLELGIII